MVHFPKLCWFTRGSWWCLWMLKMWPVFHVVDFLCLMWAREMFMNVLRGFAGISCGISWLMMVMFWPWMWRARCVGGDAMTMWWRCDKDDDVHDDDDDDDDTDDDDSDADELRLCALMVLLLPPCVMLWKRWCCAAARGGAYKQAGGGCCALPPQGVPC